MAISYERLSAGYFAQFIELRIMQLEDEGAVATCDLHDNLLQYYEEHLADGSFFSWIAIEDGKVVATSGMTLTHKPPYYNNTTGKIGILSSMFTLKEYRRMGIAKKLMDRVIGDAKELGYDEIHVNASDMGVLLYTSYGFEMKKNFMKLKIK